MHASVCVCACVCVCVHAHVLALAHRGKKRNRIPLTWAAGSCEFPMWVLGTELHSAERVARTLNRWAVFTSSRIIYALRSICILRCIFGTKLHNMHRKCFIQILKRGNCQKIVNLTMKTLTAATWQLDGHWGCEHQQWVTVTSQRNTEPTY